jgi:rhamnosyl/mannosyltransferase
LETELREQVVAANLQKKVFFVGEVSDEDVVTHLRVCDIFVLPSIFQSGTFGIVQLEAMACGKPVVCTELGTGTSFVNQHERTGLVVQPNDSHALSQAINYLLANPEIRERYGQAGRERMEKYFTKEAMINSVIATYHK